MSVKGSHPTFSCRELNQVTSFKPLEVDDDVSGPGAGRSEARRRSRLRPRLNQPHQSASERGDAQGPATQQLREISTN